MNAVLLVVLFLAAATPGSVFENVTTKSGIAWRHDNGETPQHFLPETTTGGVGFIDFDADGWQDIYLVPGKPGSTGALYRNLHDGKFQDVTAKSGLSKLPFYGMGIAAADIDGDGYPEVYISGYPSGALFQNNGDGTFRDITAEAGVANQGEWGASAAWFDYDRDGLLDLFIANYVQFSYEGKERCEFAGEPAYCAQTEYRGSRSRLYRNLGNGKFQDVSEASGVAASPGRALGVVAIDADGDGWTDLFVARDASPNLLLINRHDGTFQDRAVEREVAYNSDGVARSGMGVDAADLNGDGLPDFALTNFDHEFHALYLSHAGQPYTDAAASSGMARFTQPYVGWGVRFADFLRNGSAGLFISNGHIHPEIARANSQVAFREPPLLLLSNEAGTFRSSEVAVAPQVGRGLATGDFDNDGRIDVLLANLGSSPVLLHNVAPSANHWVGVTLVGAKLNHDAIGARVLLKRAARNQTRWIVGGGSFLSTHDYRLVFGLGQSTKAGSVEVQWPDGHTQQSAVLIDRYNTINER